MQLLLTTDTTTLSHWLNWRVGLCAIWILTSMATSSYIIWKCEGSDHPKHHKRESHQLPQLFHDDDAWRTSLREVHPIWLLAFRVLAFSLFLAILIVEIVIHGVAMLFYYTQWTFTLVTIYFGFGSVLSMYGCFQRHEIAKRFNIAHSGISSEQGYYLPPAFGEATNLLRPRESSSPHEDNHVHVTAGIWGFLFQVMFQISVLTAYVSFAYWEPFQVNAGAAVLTDCIYWCIIFPFLTIQDYDLHFMTFIMHSLNAVFLLGDASLNCLRFPWFRCSYFILWTGIFVISQWIIHACVSIRWPYPFLDLSSSYSPLWYILIGLLHIPCYGIFLLVVELKVQLLSKWFPQSYQCIRL